MKIKILAFGIAKDILQTRSMHTELSTAVNVKELKEHLIERYPDFQKLKSLKLAVNEEYRNDDFIISDGDEVALIPPVSGG